MKFPPTKYERFSVFSSSYNTVRRLDARPDGAQAVRDYIVGLFAYGFDDVEPDFDDDLMDTAFEHARASVNKGRTMAENGAKKGKSQAESQASTLESDSESHREQQTDSTEEAEQSQTRLDKTRQESPDTRGSLLVDRMDDEGIGAGVSDPAPAETYTPMCPNGCTKPDGSPSDMKLDAEAEGLRCSVCGELLVIE